MTLNEILKKLRKEKRMTLDVLAQKTGFTKGYLSKIERSEKQPPFATLEILAEALDISLQELLDVQEDGEIPVFPKAPVSENAALHQTKLLISDYKKHQMAPFVLTIGHGVSKMISHTDEEFIYVLHGNLNLHANGDVIEMSEGDCFYIEADTPHCYCNLSDDFCVTLNIKCNSPENHSR